MSHGFTDLHIAAWHGRLDEVERLLEAKADPLQTTAFYGDAESGPWYNRVDKRYCFNAIGLALLGGHPDVAIYLHGKAKANDIGYRLNHLLSEEQKAYLNSR